MKRRLSLVLAVGALQILTGAAYGANDVLLPRQTGSDVNAKEDGTPFIFGQLKPAPAGSKLITVPVLSPGEPAWVTVIKDGQPVADVSVLVDGVVFNTDPLGQAALQIPKVQAVT